MGNPQEDKLSKISNNDKQAPSLPEDVSYYTLVESSFDGPIPHPQILRGYEDIYALPITLRSYRGTGMCQFPSPSNIM